MLGITGAIYAFVDELKPIVYHDRFYIEPQNTPVLPLSVILSEAQEALGKEYPLMRAEIPAAPDRAYVFRATKINEKGWTHWSYFEYYFRVYVNPYTGKVIHIEDTKNEFFHLVLSMHMRLLLGERISHHVIGYSVCAFVIILISGIVLWWPGKWSKSQKEKSFTVKWTGSRKRINYDLHNVLGFYAFLLLLIMGITGLVWVYEWTDNSVRFVANGARVIARQQPPLSDTTRPGSGLDVAFHAAVRQYPDARSFLINIPAKKNAVSISMLTYHTNWNRSNRTSQFYDQYTGRLLRSQDFGDLNGGDKAYQLNYDLHTGAVLGLPGKILAFFASLICASLPVTGFNIWWSRRKKKTRGTSSLFTAKSPGAFKPAERYRKA